MVFRIDMDLNMKWVATEQVLGWDLSLLER